MTMKKDLVWTPEADPDGLLTELTDRRKRMTACVRKWQGLIRQAVLKARNAKEMLIAAKRISDIQAASLAVEAKEYADALSELLRAAGIDVDTRRQIRTDTWMRYVTPLRHAPNDLMARLSQLAHDKQGEHRNIHDIRTEALREFARSGIARVQYRNGTRQRLDTYVTMAVRTEQTETQTLTEVAQAQETGTNYVYLPPTPNGCPVCGEKCDRIYCIDPSRGNPLNAPALYGVGGLYDRGYHTIHPNCRCVPIAYYPDFDPDLNCKLQRTARAKSEDSRAERVRWQYAASVAYGRRRLAEAAGFRESVERSNRTAEVLQHTTPGNYRRHLRAQEADYNRHKNALGNRFPFRSIRGYRIALTAWEKMHNGNHDGFWEAHGGKIKRE